MREALELARLGKGRAEPNPMVGCVIVKDGVAVGRGYHRKFGGPHAEADALLHAGDRAEGADVYVTLEPCAHWGKTPPCTDALIKAKVKRVFAAMEDPFPQTHGIGPRKLREAGVAVEFGLLAEDARELNAPYLKLITQGQSYVIAKWAMSLDGKISTRTGDSKWISSDASRRVVHELRNDAAAVMVGLGTVLQDDPELTCRLDGGRNPCRIIVDSSARTPVESRLVRTARDISTIIAVTQAAPPQRVKALEDAGCAVLRLDSADGRVDVRHLLRETAAMRLTNVLVEGGSRLLGSMFESGMVDEVRVFVAPIVIGGQPATTPVAGQGVAAIAESLRMRKIDIRRIGDDFMIEARI